MQINDDDDDENVEYIPTISAVTTRLTRLRRRHGNSWRKQVRAAAAERAGQ